MVARQQRDIVRNVIDVGRVFAVAAPPIALDVLNHHRWRTAKTLIGAIGASELGQVLLFRRRPVEEPSSLPATR